MTKGFRPKVSAKRRHALPLRLYFTLFFLLTFSVQSYVTATHIHNPAAPDLGFSLSTELAESAKADTVGAKATAQNDHNRVPARDARDDCPFCNAVAHAGAFLFPSLLVLTLPADGVVIAGSAVPTLVATAPLSHSWESRGPPHV